MLSHMQAKGLSAGYNGQAVFRGLGLKIPEGSITTLIGSNGSGKSTILKTLCRIISPDSGAVYLDGEAIHRMPVSSVQATRLPRDLRCCRRERKPLPASQSATLWNTGVFLTGRR